MNVTPTTSSTATATGSAAQSAPGAGSEYQTFLKMLTTQLKNQDPTDPADTKEFAVQLATFSSVEQQVKTNDLLKSLLSSLGQMGMADLAGWVGSEARVSGQGYYDGSAITLSAKPASGADLSVLVVRDAKGTVVAQETLKGGAQTFDWSGYDSAGNPLPAGIYGFKLESYAGDTLLSTDPVDAYSEIIEARSGDDGTRLVLRGDIEVTSDQVTALRRAP